ncbi:MULTISPECIES: ABC transporter permease [unclassified Chelatococcus]|uniref:ABC transporter permease n=1 Tax=unclassified Chelatococcus TaxID=2638111 RepID=UPI001BD173A7|nr:MULTISPECIES: ABC transporter permease [unclassified Chelatococcus]MBS7699906.1 ABC transporter permease [Chelatococcus sp. YT9]MBX3558748.1 ABC transporter permease [Chelatococcus sp.]
MGWFIRRIAQSMVMLWVVVSLVFLSINMVPGDPVELLLAQDGASPDPATVEMVRDQLGLNRPLHEQYIQKITDILHLNLGTSIVDESSVGAEIARRLPRTLELIAAAGLLSLLIGIPTGVLAALRPNGLFGRIATFAAGTAQSIPVFILGSLLVVAFAQLLGWLPAGGFVSFERDPGKHLILLIMPAATIAIGLSAIVFRITRASMLDVLPLDFVRTARAKGVPARRVLVRHALRNALMPVITVFALQLGGLLAGTVLVETVFNWPGLSGMLVTGVNTRDYPVVTGVIVVVAAFYIGLNLLVDIVYGLTDPRVRR